MTGFSIDEILKKKKAADLISGDAATGEETPSHNLIPEYHHCNRHLRLYTSSPPPPPLLPPLRLSQHTHYHHRISYSSLQPHRFFNRPPSPLHSAISPSGSAHSDDLDVDKLSRRPRTSITVCQREFLETEFQKERYPTLAYIDKLSRKVHLQQYVIKVWFQNRRAKFRKEGYRRKPATAVSRIDTTKVDNSASNQNIEHTECGVAITNRFIKTDGKKHNNRRHDKLTSSMLSTPDSHDRYSTVRYNRFHNQTRDRYCYGTRGDMYCQCLTCRLDERAVNE